MTRNYANLALATRHYLLRLEQLIQGHIADGDSGPIYQQLVATACEVRKLLASIEPAVHPGPVEEAKDRLARIDSTMQILNECDPIQDAERIRDCLHATLVVVRELAAKEPR